jgi:hypothetical protein
VPPFRFFPTRYVPRRPEEHNKHHLAVAHLHNFDPSRRIIPRRRLPKTHPKCIRERRFESRERVEKWNPSAFSARIDSGRIEAAGADPNVSIYCKRNVSGSTNSTIQTKLTTIVTVTTIRVVNSRCLSRALPSRLACTHRSGLIKPRQFPCLHNSYMSITSPCGY